MDEDEELSGIVRLMMRLMMRLRRRRRRRVCQISPVWFVIQADDRDRVGW